MRGGGIVEKVQEEQEQKSRLELAVIEISFHHVGKEWLCTPKCGKRVVHPGSQSR